ncbi:uncharacterized protein LOC106180801 [Lingula anatina]|uniref:Uncharacterized protein LOC106180801 n=1 Tax=Lingula anatina TaxID=7574 RepID=A0A1S3KCM9_LINAN|nr:uncharacterized protein LOC106180801 [Lingula anatina]|eukprot:XP_013420388.1 uncharacterized protein LOC106180801 [Lingula anatina]
MEGAAKPTKISLISTKTFKTDVIDFFLWKKKKQANTPEIQKLKHLPEANIYKVIYDVANEIAVCYGCQIGSLNTNSDVHSLAEFAVFCMLETLRCEDDPFNRNRMLLSILERNDLSVLKRNHGFEDREVFTTSGKTWRLSEIFREPGICMPVVEKEKGDIKMMLYQGTAGEEKYGFRFPLTVWDEDQQKFAVYDGDQQYMDSCDQREDDKHSLLSTQSLPTLVLYNSDLFLEYIEKAASEKKKMTFGDFVNGKAKEPYLFIVLRPVDGFSSTTTPFLETMTQCDFSNTDLSFLRFSKITKEIKGCSFSSGNLSNTDMSDVVITESDFSYADLSFASLIGSNLRNSENTWKDTVFWYTDLSNAKLSEELGHVLKKWDDINLEGSSILSHPSEEMATKSKTVHEDDPTTAVKSRREGAEAVEKDFQDVQSKKGASQLPESEEESSDDSEEDPDTVDSFQESGGTYAVFLPMEPDRGKMQTPLSELSEDNSQQIRQEADQLNAAMAGSGDVNFVYAWAACDARDHHNVFLVVYVRSLEENRCLFLKQKLEEMKCAKYKIWQFNKPIRSKFPRCHNMEPVPPNWVSKMWKTLYEHSMKLFQEHSNISYMTASKFEIDRNGHCHRKDCVVVYVRDKGYIPANERSFPKRLPNGISVDVREGYYCPLMDHEEGAGTTLGWAGAPRRVARAGAAGEGTGSPTESAGALEETARNHSGDGAPGVEAGGSGGRDGAAGEATGSSVESTRPGGVTGAMRGGGAPNVENRGIRSRGWAHGEKIEFLRAAVRGFGGETRGEFKQHLTIGCGISRHNDHYYGTGTLGMFVKDKLTKEIGLLTAAHTLIAQTQMVIPVPEEIDPLALPMEGSMYPSDRSFTAQVSDEQTEEASGEGTNSPSSVPTTTPPESANASPDLRPSPVVAPVQPSHQISPFTSLPAGSRPATFSTGKEPLMLPEASGYTSCPDAVIRSQSHSPVAQTCVAETNQSISKMANVSSTSRPQNITTSTLDSLRHRTPSESAVPQDMPPTLVPNPQISPLNLRGPQFRMQGSSEELPAETFVVQPSEGEVSWLRWSSDGNERYDVEKRKCAEVKSPRMYCHGVSQSRNCDFLLKLYHQRDQPGPVPVGIDAVFASILKPRQPENSSFLQGKVSFDEPNILNLDNIVEILNGEWEAEPCLRKELDGTFSLEVFKYGYRTQLTRGKLDFVGGIPSVISRYGCSSNANILPNQMEVQLFDQSPAFADHGDSGAIVFTILKQSLYVVGMVIGRIGEKIVVTPIEPIFEKLGLEFLEKQDYLTA